jgi:prefoldin subunit 5
MVETTVDEQTKPLKEEISLLKKENQSLRKSISDIETRVDRQEQYSRKLCV